MAETLLFQTNDPDSARRRRGVVRALPGARPTTATPLVVRLFSERPGHGGGAADRGLGPRRHTGSHGDHYSDHRRLGRRRRSSTSTAGWRVGFVSAATARDGPVVRYTFIEAMALSMLARSRGYFVLHAAGVVRDGDRGRSLAGPAGAGKSTLAMACARRGFGVFAEDAVFVAGPAGRARAVGHALDAAAPARRPRRCSRSSPDSPDRTRSRTASSRSRSTSTTSTRDARSRAPRPGRSSCCRATTGADADRSGCRGRSGRTLEVHWPWDGGWTAAHERGARELAAHGVYRLHINGTPDEAVDALEELVRA